MGAAAHAIPPGFAIRNVAALFRAIASATLVEPAAHIAVLCIYQRPGKGRLDASINIDVIAIAIILSHFRRHRDAPYKLQVQ